MTKKNINWAEVNQNYLVAAIKVLQTELMLMQHSNENDPGSNTSSSKSVAELKSHLAEAEKQLPSPAALEIIVRIFGLSAFERKVLLMGAGIELDPGFAALVAELQGSNGLPLPSFSLAMNALDGAHWSAISPERPLRYWRMIEINAEKSAIRGSYKIDEQLLHFITGLDCIDERLSPLMEEINPVSHLAPSHRELAESIFHTLEPQLHNPHRMPFIQLSGSEGDKEGIAALVASLSGRKLLKLSPSSFPIQKTELGWLIRLWNRESALHGYILYLDCTETDTADHAVIRDLTYLIENTHSPLIVSTERWNPKTSRPGISFDAQKPARQEQSKLWKESLSELHISLNGQIDKLVAQFNLDARAIRQISSEMTSTATQTHRGKTAESEIMSGLWKACCNLTRPRIEELAQRIEPVSTWHDIVLHDAQKDILKEIAIQVRQRKKVYEDWGFEAKNSRGLGISAMFTGESGTGKTMAAEVLANDLHLDLYRIDLSQVVNKYIGETEKNLKKIFDAAESGGAILLFDEADALFGKRSEVRDSHDRYSNIEVSYLLQRMEAYRGLAILTTNMKSALDKAFLRRIRFIVQFPFPGFVQRLEIWSKVFPADTPVSILNLEKLAKMDIPGGNIRNIALNAAFLAAGENLPVNMKHILRAARTEFSKLEKSMNITE